MWEMPTFNLHGLELAWLSIQSDMLVRLQHASKQFLVQRSCERPD